jgi:DNA-binding transcriptional LysR family regulator
MSQRNPLPSLDLLKGFEVVARHLSFTKAAAELCVTQSAVSRQIRQLEDHLGVRLFERRTRAVVLTDAGYRYYTELTPLLARLGEVTQQVTAARTDTRVRVTCTVSFASLWLIPRLAAFQEKHPQIHVHVVGDNVVRDLVRDAFDVGIRYCLRAEVPDDAVLLFGERLAPVCSAELASRAGLARLDDLDRCALIHFTDLEGRAPWLSWERYFADMRHPGIRGKSTLHLSHYEQAIRAAIAGQGVALGRLPLIDETLQAGTLLAPFDAASAMKLPDRGYWLVLPEEREARPEVALFTAWLQNEARVTRGAER